MNALTKHVRHLLMRGNEKAIILALETLLDKGEEAYGGLLDIVESCVESNAGMDEENDCLLFAIPVLAWSRFSLPSGTLKTASLQDLSDILAKIVFTEKTEFQLANFIFSLDLLPKNFTETDVLFQTLKQCLESGTPFPLPTIPGQQESYLCDPLYFVGIAKIKKGLPIFRWQDTEQDKQLILNAWQEAATTALRPLFLGCTINALLPNAYHGACRDSENKNRAFSLQSAIGFLTQTLNVPAVFLDVIIGSFYDDSLSEYRISFLPHDNDEIIHGVVWPLLDNDEESMGILEGITELLREAGVMRITLSEQHYGMEFCDDCGSPLYPNRKGELAHVEAPSIESANDSTHQLH